jgi:hypothetical protein
MRHATPEDLNRLEALLEKLRTFPRLRERKRGSFSCGSRALLHFHEDAGDLYADVKIDGEFRRMRVTNRQDQAALLKCVREELESVP